MSLHDKQKRTAQPGMAILSVCKRINMLQRGLRWYASATAQSLADTSSLATLAICPALALAWVCLQTIGALKTPH